MFRCRVCSAEGNFPTYHTHEIQMGLGDFSSYFRCEKCGCLQIVAIPENLARYYPSNYYSFATPNPNMCVEIGRISRFLFYHREYYNLTHKSFLGWLFYQFQSKRTRRFCPPIVDWRRIGDWDRKQRILDVGCGAGEFLFYLHQLGFRHLTGIDPFGTDRVVSDRFSLYRRYIDDQEGQFDRILLSHSLEHMEHPLSTLRHVKRLLAPDGIFFLRMPLYSEYMFQRFGTAWQAWDPPRHFYLHTLESLQILLDTVGLTVVKREFDTLLWNIIMSELFQRFDIDLKARDEAFRNEENQRQWHQEYASLIQKLNAEEKSDCCNFLIRHA